jgi:hypothetical protein
MEQKEPAARTREDYRHLPPRITPEEMIPLQAVVRAREDVPQGTEDEWRIRMGGA